ncbi:MULTISPECIES: lyase family protein [unclassified Bacillus (in: firmicutes)]|uniref:lyase family protein n=1 Tax=unclassified Bacillus (in: firmicutes) TaxID=185979 RepID=UPI0020361D7C|nr:MULTISPECIES: lyase family protein [unclassified Bacillus (in: firmicutes)]
MRVEEDAIGKVELPKEALYGINTVRTIENLSFSNRTLKQYPLYVEALLIVKKSAAAANAEAKVLSKEVGEQISFACNQLLSGANGDQFLIDVLHGGGGIGTNMNVNEVIANFANAALGVEKGGYAPIHPTEHVNASQSTSDVCHTAIRIAIISSFQLLRQEIYDLIEKVAYKANEFGDITTISRTCLQDAMRVRLGEKFSGYAAMLERRLKHMEKAVEQLHAINLGGTVIGSGVGASDSYRDVIVRKLTEASGLLLDHRENLFDAAQNMDDLADVSSELKQLASCLIKFAKDLRLLSSGPEAGFGEIVLPAVQAGSSFFPGKINPVIPETLIQCCFQVLGCDRVVQAALEHGELDLNVFEGAAGVNILDAMNMLSTMLPKFTMLCINGMAANAQRCEQLSNGLIPLVVTLKEKYGYAKISTILKEEGREGVKQLFYNGGETNDTNQ